MKGGNNHSVPKMLAVVRCGDSSIHESWSRGNRSFDLAVSYFGGDPSRVFEGSKYVHFYKGGKWDGIYNFFEQFEALIDEYDYFWFPDDDISGKASEVEQLSYIAFSKGIPLIQPALDINSYYSHLTTLQHRSCMIRYTNFVEIMAPMMSQDMLRLVLPTIQNTRTGFGLDFVWPEMAAKLGYKAETAAAIADSITICHTRPVGGNLHAMIRSLPGASSGNEELRNSTVELKASRHSQINGVPVPRIKVYSAVSTQGQPVGRFHIFYYSFFDLMWSRNKQIAKPSIVSITRHALKALLT